MSVAAAAAGAGTLLFVPADRPERFAKADGAGADLVILDLEDAVAPEHKDAARDHAAGWARRHACAVRINAPGTPWHAADLAALAGLGATIVLPKSERTADLAAAAAGGAGVIALIETARGIAGAGAIADTGGVVRLALGSFDLAAELGIDPTDREALLASRSALVLASAMAGLSGPVDGVTAGIDDPHRITDDTTYARRLGFAGKLCIHPAQLAPTAAALRPTPEQIAWAERVLAAGTDGGVANVDGEMVDKPVLDRALRILARSTPI